MKWLLICLIFISCSSPSTKSKSSEKINNNQHLLLSTIWFQNSAEAKALFLQSYNLAKMSLEKSLRQKKNKKLAVVLDLDETVLDNSPYQARLILTGENYPVYWNEWIDAARAEALPGSREFLTWAKSKGVEIYYISNRKASQFEATKKNLLKMGIPLLSDEHLLLQTAENNKTARREIVSKKAEIVLLIGDNLNDFTGLYEKKSVLEREQITFENKAEFGKKFIMMPNPLYGDWEGAMLDYYKNKYSEVEKDQKRKSYLKTF